MTPYYSDNMVTIYHGDCLDILPGVDADLMITDPPYGRSFESNWDSPHAMIYGDESTDVRDSVLELWADRPALVFGQWQNPLPKAKAALVWDKGPASGMGDLSMPWKPDWELIFVMGKGFEGHRGTSIISGHTVVTWASKGRCHPNMKPKGLIVQLLRKCAFAKSVVDPFMGSGSTLVACRESGVRSIGIEIDEKYCEIAAKRVAQRSLFEVEA
jgi:DNA modification methylase